MQKGMFQVSRGAVKRPRLCKGDGCENLWEQTSCNPDPDISVICQVPLFKHHSNEQHHVVVGSPQQLYNESLPA